MAQHFIKLIVPVDTSSQSSHFIMFSDIKTVNANLKKELFSAENINANDYFASPAQTKIMAAFKTSEINCAEDKYSIAFDIKDIKELENVITFFDSLEINYEIWERSNTKYHSKYFCCAIKKNVPIIPAIEIIYDVLDTLCTDFCPQPKLKVIYDTQEKSYHFYVNILVRSQLIILMRCAFRKKLNELIEIIGDDINADLISDESTFCLIRNNNNEGKLTNYYFWNPEKNTLKLANDLTASSFSIFYNTREQTYFVPDFEDLYYSYFDDEKLSKYYDKIRSAKMRYHSKGNYFMRAGEKINIDLEVSLSIIYGIKSKYYTRPYAIGLAKAFIAAEFDKLAEPIFVKCWKKFGGAYYDENEIKQILGQIKKEHELDMVALTKTQAINYLSTFYDQPHMNMAEPFLEQRLIPRSFIVENIQAHQNGEASIELPAFDKLLGGAHSINALIVKSPMGTGKTKRLIEFIDSLDSSLRIVIVSFRRTFTSEMFNKLSAYKNGVKPRRTFFDYREINGSIQHRNIIVQYETMNRLFLPMYPGRETVFILDEVLMILNQIENMRNRTSNTGDNYVARTQTSIKNWNTFEYFMLNAKYVVALDANADSRAYNLFLHSRRRTKVLVSLQVKKKKLRPILNMAEFHNDKSRQNICEPNINNQKDTSRVLTDCYYQKFGGFLCEIYSAMKNARKKPIVIATNCKSFATAMNYKARNLNNEAVIKFYSQDSSTKDRDDFKNVSEAWVNVDILIYTPTLTAGVSYENERFDKCFSYFINKSCDYLSCSQMLGRVRNLSSGQNHIFINMMSASSSVLLKDIQDSIIARRVICDIITNPLGRPTYINAKGKTKLTYDLYYSIHIANILHFVQSENNFEKLFISVRLESGYFMKWINSKTCDEHKNMEADYKMIVNEIITGERDMLASAIPLDDDEYINCLNTRRTGALSENFKLRFAKTNLAKFYGVSADKINNKFIEIFNKEKVRRQFERLGRLFIPGCKVKDTINNIRAIEHYEINGRGSHTLHRNNSNYDSVFIVIVYQILCLLFGDDKINSAQFLQYWDAADDKDERIECARKATQYITCQQTAALIRSATNFYKCSSDFRYGNFSENMRLLSGIIERCFGAKLKYCAKNNSYKLQPFEGFIYCDEGDKKGYCININFLENGPINTRAKSLVKKSGAKTSRE